MSYVTKNAATAESAARVAAGGLAYRLSREGRADFHGDDLHTEAEREQIRRARKLLDEASAKAGEALDALRGIDLHFED